MSDIKLPRLLAAAREFNIGQDTLIDFLAGKGFDKDELKPTAKLSLEMYQSLQKEFASDKQAKEKSDAIDLPKGVGTDQRRKKEEEEITFGKEVKRSHSDGKEIIGQIDEPVVVEKKEPEPEPVTEPTMLDVVEDILPKADHFETPEPVIEETTAKIAAPKVEGPKIVGTVDLSKIDNSTKPKKGKTVEETPAPPQPEPEAQKEEQEEPEAEQPVEETTGESVSAAPPSVENIRPTKISGPKVVGKIDLPVEEVKPAKQVQKPHEDRDREKRKRKRIPISGKGEGGSNRPAAGNRPRIDKKRPAEDRVIDEKTIQEKLSETQRRMNEGANAGKAQKARARRERKKTRREELESAEAMVDDTVLEVTEFISVSDLANLMNVAPTEVIAKCMSVGVMASINQRLDAEVIELVASEFGFETKFVDLEDSDDDDDEGDQPEDNEPRAPIVTIMGHVDHGKTSLLDYIRNANVVSGEAGGITQHIGAYEVTTASGKKVTFLDTPGHEAFTAMRARGAKITDIAVIVIAADDAVMPQTKEAISHAQAAGVPMIFAINKIDKDGANPQKIYEQLAGMNLLVEDWGGKFQSQEISAKQGLNIDLLLEKILLEAEILDLKANTERESVGTVVEASLDKGRGYVATVLVQNGTLNIGDVVVSGPYFGRVKAMFNERNQRIESAGPSSPALILGLNGAPQAGEKFREYFEESEAKQVAYRRGQILREQGIRTRKHITLDEIGRRLALGNFKELNVIIKGDVDGSVEALSDSLQKLSTEEILVKVILKGVGAISENDVTLASASDAIIIGFNVRANSQANKLAEQEGIEIKQYSVIYNAINDVKDAMEGLLEPKIEEKEIATVEIREVFKFDKATVAGCYVLEGKIKRDAKIRLYRDGVLIYPRAEGAFAELGSLKRFKDDVKEVVTGMECGLTIKNFSDIQSGDQVVAFEQEEVKRTL